jgi:hypothetical protein
MWNVWRTVLEENEKLARARLAAVEVFHQQIADDAKVLKAHKVQTARKVEDILLLAHKSCHHFLWFLNLQYGVTYTCRRKVRQGSLNLSTPFTELHKYALRLEYMTYLRVAQKLQHVFPLCACSVVVETFFNNRDVWYLKNIYHILNYFFR